MCWRIWNLARKKKRVFPSFIGMGNALFLVNVVRLYCVGLCVTDGRVHHLENQWLVCSLDGNEGLKQNYEQEKMKSSTPYGA